MPAQTRAPRKDKKGRTQEQRRKEIKRGPAQLKKKIQKQPFFVTRQQARPKAAKEVTYEVTFNLSTALKNMCGMKRRAPRAVRDIKHYARRFMNTQVVKLDSDLNKYLWSQGIRNPPKKLRLVFERKPVETTEEEQTQGKQQYYTLIKYKLVPTFVGLSAARLDASSEESQE